MKLKSIFIRLGLKIRNIGPEDVKETVGYLAKMEGYEAASHIREEETDKIPEEVLVMKGFSGSQIDELLLAIRKAKLPKIQLKAIITEENAGWTFYQLYQEIKKEHEAMSGGTGAV